MKIVPMKIHFKPMILQYDINSRVSSWEKIYIFTTIQIQIFSLCILRFCIFIKINLFPPPFLK